MPWWVLAQTRGLLMPLNLLLGAGMHVGLIP